MPPDIELRSLERLQDYRNYAVLLDQEPPTGFVDYHVVRHSFTVPEYERVVLYLRDPLEESHEMPRVSSLSALVLAA